MTNCRAIVSIPKTCQRCGVEFACGGGCCWCAEVPLTPERRGQLQAQFSDCLCRACLEAVASAAAESFTPQTH